MSQNRARPKRSARPPRTGRAAENATHKLIQDIVDFQEFQETVLPALRKDLKAGLTPAQLREKYASLVQARMITDALTNEDAGRAAPIAKDILDRVEGKATEKKEITHRLDKVSEKELDALIASEEEDLADMEERFEQ